MKKFLNLAKVLSIIIGAVIVQTIIVIIGAAVYMVIGIPKVWHYILTIIYHKITHLSMREIYMKRWLVHIVKWEKYIDYQYKAAVPFLKLLINNHNWCCDYFGIPDDLKITEEL